MKNEAPAASWFPVKLVVTDRPESVGKGKRLLTVSGRAPELRTSIELLAVVPAQQGAEVQAAARRNRIAVDQHGDLGQVDLLQSDGVGVDPVVRVVGKADGQVSLAINNSQLLPIRSVCELIRIDSLVDLNDH